MTTPPTPAELELLQKLLNGQLPVAEVERLAAEYADDQRIAELAEAAVRNDTLLDSIRGHRTIPDVETERIVERLISRIKEAGSPNDEGDETTGLPGVTPSEQPQIPEWLEYFRIKSVLGQGGMGTVYLADDTRLDRPVAVKTLRVGAMLNPGAKDRFLREARLAAKLEHDHIIPIYYVGESNGIPFLAMPLLQGEPLDRCLQRQAMQLTTLPVGEAIRIAGQIASGLAAAHAQGLIHRDIKPANVWVEAPTGRVKILDFGLARSQQDSTITASGAVVGTPAYMAPEQARGLPVDHRADLFSLGCVLYEMVTGRRPFKGPDTMAILTSLAVDTPQQPHEVNPQCPLGLSQLTMRLLAKQPDQRPASATEVVTLLATLEPTLKVLTPRNDRLVSNVFLDGSDERGHLTTRVEPVRPDAMSRKRRRLTVAVVAALLALLVGGAYGGTVYRIATNQGELVIEIDDPDVEVKLLQGGVVVKDMTGRREFTLTAGKGEIEVFEKDGVKLSTKEFELTRGGQSRVKVTIQELADARKPKNSLKPEPKATNPPHRATDEPQQDVRPSAALIALQRGKIPVEALAAAGGGDPQKAPPSLVGVLGVSHATHTEACRTVAFSPNGRWLATGSDDKAVILHDLTTDRVSRVLRGHTGAVSSVVFSKDSRTVISASLDGTLKLWPTERDAEAETLQPKVGEILAMSASADGRFLAVGGTKAPIKLWKWGMWKTPSDVGIGEGKVTALAFSPDGETLASGWEDRQQETSIRIYKTADFKLVHSLTGHKNRIHALAFSPTGNALASAGGFPQLKVWNPASGKLTGEITGIPEGYGAAPSVAFGANETSLVFTMQGGPQLLLYDLETGKQRPLAGGALAISVAFGPEGKLLAVGSSSGGVYLADAKTWEPKNLEGGHRHSVNVAVFGPDGQTILSGGDDSTLRRWDLREVGKNQVIREFRDSVGLLAASPDGKTIAASAFPPGHGYWANVSDAVSGKELFRVYPLTLSKLAYSPDRKTLVVGYGNFFEAGNLRLWDLGLGEEVHRFAGPGIWHAVEFRADGKGIAAVDLHANFVRVWDVASGAEKSTWKDAFNPKKEFMPAAAIRPDFGLLAVGHDDGTIAVWDVATRQLKRTLAGHTGRPRMLKFTPDGSMLVSSGNDGTIRVWNPDVERSRAVIPLGPKNSPLTFDLDPSGKYICAIGNSPLIFVLRLAGVEK